MSVAESRGRPGRTPLAALAATAVAIGALSLAAGCAPAAVTISRSSASGCDDKRPSYMASEMNPQISGRMRRLWLSKMPRSGGTVAKPCNR